MKLIKEPLEIDFLVDPRPLTKNEQFAITEYIKADKAKRALSEKRLMKTHTSSNSKRPVN